MAQDTTCHLLELPRELRDRIYDNVTVSLEGHGFTLRDTIQASLSRTCRQINAEYTDRALSRTELRIYDVDHFDDSPTQFKVAERCVPLTVLKKIKHCTLDVEILDLIRDVDEDDVVDWLLSSPIASIHAQDDASWTPSQAFVTRLQEIVDQMSLYVSHTAKAVVQIDVSELAIDYQGYDSRGDFFSPLEWLQVPRTHEIEDRLALVAFLPTLSRLTTERTTVLPITALELNHGTFLSWSMAENGAEIRANREAVRNGLEVEIVEPKTDHTGEVVEWILHEMPEARDWRDCFAEFKHIC